MRIRWTTAAAGDLEQINDYLKDRHSRYRLPTMRKLYQAIGTLKKWPQSGRMGREAGTRELLFSPLPYVCVYRITEQSIEILRIYHTSQDR
jgi:toxin ParE1/3/4